MANRSPGSGYIEQLKSGTWRGQIMDGYTEDGKKKILSFTGSSKKDVSSQIRAYQTRREANLHIAHDITFRDWSNNWYANFEDQVEASTYCNYKYTLRILQDEFGARKLMDILPLEIEDFLKGLKGVRSDSQISKCRAMLIQIYDAADANGLVLRNPARQAKKVKRKRRVGVPVSALKGKKDAFTDEEVATIIREHPDDLMGNSICLLLGTGMREQELLALTADDIAEDGSWLTVNKAVQTVNGRSVLGPPKSESGNRIIPVPTDYRQYAVFLREHGGSPFLWTRSQKNDLYSIRSFQKRFATVIGKMNGVRPLTPHCCRHTYVTRLQAKGIPMETIARLAGHSRIETTDKYLHTPKDVLRSAVSVLNQTEDGSKTDSVA